MGTSRTPRPASDVIWQILDDGVMLVSPVTGQVRVLNETGTKLWQLLNDGLSLAEIEANFVQNYKISLEQAKKDVGAFVSELLTKGLLIEGLPN